MSLLRIVIFIALLISLCVLMYQSVHFMFVLVKLKMKKISGKDYEVYLDKNQKPLLVNLGLVFTVTTLFNLMD